MVRSIKQNNDKRLSSHAVNILINHAIFQFGGALSIIFVNLYLWRLTNSLWVNGIYNLVAILSQAATTFLIGKMSKKKGRTTIYRYGILMTAIFYLLIVIVQEEIVHYFYLFALLRGIAQGLYWVAYFTIVHEVSSDQNRHRYLGWNQIVMGSANLVAPALAGFIIGLSTGLSGYLIVFSVAFLMFLTATIGSFRIKKESIRHRNYYMKYLGQIIERKKAFRHALTGWFIIGFPQGILMYLPPILIYSIFEDESVVGYLNAGFLAVSILASYIISRFANIEQTKKYLWIAAIGFFVAGSFLTWEIATWSVILFMVTQNMFKPLQANAYAAYYFQWIDRIPLGSEFRVESVVLRETIINVGRGLGIIVFMVFSNEIDTSTVAYVIMLAMAIQFILPMITKLKEES
ncbi:MFS transporter, YQGE family, putative transporter [Gracilibacillus orientalis]|uniref:MFS transporter, YQGE family, putative transporter n=1 Tax=Gracilibacillus orientalis TaxID=334253 RepID=A0A1I4JMV7_9BACI|nr:MFS transporter [Gracilibacillus orientalis]SFL67543.1 MFS transporter, YQGE family, putative transporter [Gracilibacillus orientalis]